MDLPFDFPGSALPAVFPDKMAADVAPIHPDATPVLLLDADAREMWMNAPMDMALSLQRPSPPGALKIVATDTKQDAA